MSLPFLHDVQDVVQQLLIDLGLGTDPASWAGGGVGSAWPVFSDSEPNLPDNCITVKTTSPRVDGRSMLDGEVWKHDGFQVRVRGIDEPTAMTKAEAIRVALNERVYQAVVSLTSPTATYAVPCINGTNNIRLGTETPKSKRHIRVVNGLSPILRLT